MRLLFALSLFCLLLSCRCGKKHTYFFTTTTRAWFADFGENSYWVFQNEEDPADVDTLMLVNKKTGMEYNFTEQECDGNDFEFAHYGLLSTRTKDTISVTNRARVTLDIHTLAGLYHTFRLFSSIDPLKDDKSFGVNTYAHDSLGIYPTYLLGGKTYSDVMSMTFRQLSPSFPQQAPTYVYAKNIGLIAFSIYDKNTESRKSFMLIAHKILK